MLPPWNCWGPSWSCLSLSPPGRGGCRSRIDGGVKRVARVTSRGEIQFAHPCRLDGQTVMRQRKASRGEVRI